MLNSKFLKAATAGLLLTSGVAFAAEFTTAVAGIGNIQASAAGATGTSSSTLPIGNNGASVTTGGSASSLSQFFGGAPITAGSYTLVAPSGKSATIVVDGDGNVQSIETN